MDYYAAAYAVCALTLVWLVAAGRRNRAGGASRAFTAVSFGTAPDPPVLPLARPTPAGGAAGGHQTSQGLLHLWAGVGPSGQRRPEPEAKPRLSPTRSNG
jgi:hypothetical protein